MHSCGDKDTDTLSDGLVIALKMTNGCLGKCSKTVKHSTDGLKLMDVDQPLRSSFPEVFKTFPQVLTCCTKLIMLMKISY